MSVQLEQTIGRGIELLNLLVKLQSEKDGISRPLPFEVDPSKTLDTFAKDVGNTATYFVSLLKLIPASEDLVALGKKLESDGVIDVLDGDAYDIAALNYILQQHGLEQSLKP